MTSPRSGEICHMAALRACAAVGGRMAQTKFELKLSAEERQYLLDLVRSRITLALHDQKVGFPPPPPPGALSERLGAFVTLKKNGQLRGCIGRLVSPDPLYATVGDMAEASAFNDSRFSPVTLNEFSDLEVEISVMGPITKCEDLSAIEVGRHGLIAQKGQRRGLLLPQVAVEWEWDRETFLAQTCRKAGLPSDAWHDPDTQVFWFEAFII